MLFTQKLTIKSIPLSVGCPEKIGSLRTRCLIFKGALPIVAIGK